MNAGERVLFHIVNGNPTAIHSLALPLLAYALYDPVSVSAISGGTDFDVTAIAFVGLVAAR